MISTRVTGVPSTDATNTWCIILITIIAITIVIIVGQRQPPGSPSPARAPPPLSPPDILASVALFSPASLPPSSFYVAAPLRPPPPAPLPFLLPLYFISTCHKSVPLQKQLPSLFWAIICGSAARAGPPGRQSPGNRVSASYCGVCPSRSITRRLTPRGRRPESPLGHPRHPRPVPPRGTTGPGRGDPASVSHRSREGRAAAPSHDRGRSSRHLRSPLDLGGRLRLAHGANVIQAQRGEGAGPRSHSVGEAGLSAAQPMVTHQGMLFPRTCLHRTGTGWDMFGTQTAALI